MTYQTEALSTKSDQFHEEMVTAGMLREGIEYALSSTDIIDKLKKALFYGKDAQDSFRFYFGSTIPPGSYGDINKDVIHAIVGARTEADELLVILGQALCGKNIDRDKVIDEAGDLIWYVNLLLSAVGSSIEEAQVANLAKLKARFPEKFTSERAINRDVQAESKAQRGVMYY